MDGCSSIASKGANDERFVAQNWDWSVRNSDLTKTV